jgi:glycine/D-amino acid oxidase-like deaminating enzyme
MLEQSAGRYPDLAVKFLILRRMTRPSGNAVDVLIIGGGITGCGVARDAAMRGLSVALFERDDFGSGTSGRSSRLVHGVICTWFTSLFGSAKRFLLSRLTS